MARTRPAGKAVPPKKSNHTSTSKPEPKAPLLQPQDSSSSRRSNIPQAAPQPRPIQIKTASKASTSNRLTPATKPPNKLGIGLYSIARVDQETSASSSSRRLTIRPKNLPNLASLKEQQDQPTARLDSPAKHDYDNTLPSSAEMSGRARALSSRPIGPRSKIKPLLPTALSNKSSVGKSGAKGRGKAGQKEEARDEVAVVEDDFDDGPESDGEWDKYGVWVPSQKPAAQTDPGEQEDATGPVSRSSPAESTEEEEERIEDKAAVPVLARHRSLTPTPTISLPIPQVSPPEPPAASNGLYPRQYIPASPAPTTPSPEDTALAALLDSQPIRDFRRISQARPAEYDPIERPDSVPGRMRHSGGSGSVSAEGDDNDVGTASDRREEEDGERERGGRQIKREPGGRRSQGPDPRAQQRSSVSRRAEGQARNSAVTRLSGAGDDWQSLMPAQGGKAAKEGDGGSVSADRDIDNGSQDGAESSEDEAGASTNDEQDAALLLTPSAIQRELIQHLDKEENERQYGSQGPPRQAADHTASSNEDGSDDEARTTTRHVFIRPAKNALKTPMTYGNKVNRFIPVPAAPRKVPAITVSESTRSARRSRRGRADSSPVKARSAPTRRSAVKEDEERGTSGRRSAVRGGKQRETSATVNAEADELDQSRDTSEGLLDAQRGSDPRSMAPSPSPIIQSRHRDRQRLSTASSRSSFRSAPMSNQQAQLVAEEEGGWEEESDDQDGAQEDNTSADEAFGDDESGIEEQNRDPIPARSFTVNVDPEEVSDVDDDDGRAFTTATDLGGKDDSAVLDLVDHDDEHEGAAGHAQPRRIRRRPLRRDPDEPTQTMSLFDRDPNSDDAGSDPEQVTRATEAKDNPSTNPRPAYTHGDNPYAGYIEWQGAQDRQLSSKPQEQEDAKAVRKAKRKEVKSALRRIEVQREKERIAAEMADNLGLAKKDAQKEIPAKRKLFVVSDSEPEEEEAASGVAWDALLPDAADGHDQAIGSRKQARGRAKDWPKYEAIFGDDDDGWSQEEFDGAHRKKTAQVGAVQLTRLANPAEGIGQDSSYWAARKEEKRAENMRKRKRRKREHSPYEGVMLDMTAAHSAAGRAEEWLQKVQEKAPRRKARPSTKRSNPNRTERYVHVHPVRQIDRISWDEHNERFDAARAFPVDTRLFQATVNGQCQAMYEIRSRKQAKRGEAAYLRPAATFPSMGSLDEDILTPAQTQSTTQTKTGGYSAGSGHTRSARARVAGAPRPPQLFFTSREPTPGRIIGAKSPRTAGSALNLSAGSKGDSVPEDEEDEEVVVPQEVRDEEDDLPRIPPPLPRAPIRPTTDKASEPAVITAKDKGKAPLRNDSSREAQEEEDDFFSGIDVPPSLPAPADENIPDATSKSITAATASDKGASAVKASTTPKTHMMNGLLMTDTMMDQLQWIKDLSLDVISGAGGPSAVDETGGEDKRRETSANKRKKPSGRRSVKENGIASDAVPTLDAWLQPLNAPPPQAEEPKTPATGPSRSQALKTPAKRKPTNPTGDAQTINTPAKRAKWEQLLNERQGKNIDNDGSSPRVQAITQPSSPVRSAQGRNVNSRPIDPFTPTATRRRAPSIPAARVGISRTQTRTTLLKQAPTDTGRGQAAGHAMLAGISYPTIMPGQMMTGATVRGHQDEEGQEEEDDLFGQRSRLEHGPVFDFDPGNASIPMPRGTARTSRSARSRSRVTSGADMSTTQRDTISARDDFEDNDDDQQAFIQQRSGVYPPADDRTNMYDNEYDLGEAMPFNYYDTQDVNARYDQMYPHDHTTMNNNQAATAIPTSRQLRRAAQHHHQDSAYHRQDHRDSSRYHAAAAPARSGQRSGPQGHQAPHQDRFDQPANDTVLGYTEQLGYQDFAPHHIDNATAGPSTLGPAFNTTIISAPIPAARKIGKSKSSFIAPRQLHQAPQKIDVPNRKTQPAPVTDRAPAGRMGKAGLPRAPKRLGSCSQKAAAQYRPLTIAGQAH